MCGIFGYLNTTGQSLDADQIHQMGSVLKHRGPDDQGIHFFQNGALGNQRLSIIDIQGGHQPFVSKDGQIVVVQNGEIFNHIELAEELKKSGVQFDTQSDTEVILRLYEKYGIDFVSRLNGMFSIAIYDGRIKSTFIIRDRIGVKPLYLFRDGANIFFASEIKAFFSVGLRKKISLQALDLFLSFNYIPLPYTIYNDVQHVMPGHYLKISSQGISEVQWWDLAARETSQRSEASWIEELQYLLSDAVRLRLRADVRFGAFLSGGLDSSAIVALMAKHLQSPVRTFCIGFDDPKYDESPYAEEVAKKFKTQHILDIVSPNMLSIWQKVMYHCDQPHGDMSFLPTYRVSELAAGHVKMVLTGDGGDELFGGYEKYMNFFNGPLAVEPEQQFQQKYFNNISLMDTSFKNYLYSSNIISKINMNASFDLAKNLYAKSSHWDRINQALYIDTMQLLPGNNLPKADRMGMAVSLEARTPFLDYRITELAFSMPGRMKVGETQTKYLLKKAVSPLIGDTLAYRKKQMFTVPVGDWFRTTLSEYCYEHLIKKNSVSKILFKEESINQMLKAHINGSANYTREIRAMLAIEHWAHAFDIKSDEIL